MKVYEEVLNKYGLQAWLLQNDVRLPCIHCKILFGGSYIIAREFSEVKLDYKLRTQGSKLTLSFFI